MKGKIILITALSALSLTTVAHAKVGDIAGEIYTTDILTQVDGRDITSYSIDGKTLIALEDLKDYGFNVYYNDNIRSVFVTKTGEVSPDFNPQLQRGSVGGKAGYYYETDINAYLNGSWIQTYSIDGKVLACVEEMGDTTKFSQFGSNRFQMGHSYDDSQRLLSLDTNPKNYGGGYNEMVKRTLDSESYYWGPIRGNCLHRGNTFFTPYTLGGLPHGGRALYYNVVLENGLMFNAHSIAQLYWLDINEPMLSQDGKTLYFINYANNGTEYKKIELDSLHVAPTQKEEYNNAALVHGTDFKAFLDGKEIHLYGIGGGDYINPDELNNEEISILKDSDDAKTAYIYGNAVRLIPLSMLEYNNDDYKQTEITYEYDIENKRVILSTK